MEIDTLKRREIIIENLRRIIRGNTGIMPSSSHVEKHVGSLGEILAGSPPWVKPFEDDNIVKQN